MKVEVRLLGRKLVRDAQGETVGDRAWRTAKTFDLLRVLALADGHPVPHDALIEHFWPSVDPVRAGTSLRTATSQIRKILGHDSVARVGNGLALRGVWVDATEYKEIARQVELSRNSGHPANVVRLVRKAEQLYAGDIDVAGSDCSPLHVARTEFRDLRMHLLLEAAEAAARCAGWRESLALAQEADRIETCDRSVRALMRAWFALGETGRPVEAFERLRAHLAEEYGVDPAPQTRALYLELVSSCADWPPRKLTIGREQEVRHIVSVVTGWLMDPAFPGGVVWMVGPRGSGREAVAREAAEALMLPLGMGSDDEGFASALELVADQGELTPGLSTAFLSQARGKGRILIVPVTGVPDQMPSAIDTTIVPVPPLEPADFRKVMALALQGRPTPRLASQLYEEAGGLPGLGCERARRWLREGLLSWTPDGVDAVSQEGNGSAQTWARLRVAFGLLPLTALDYLGVATAAESVLREGPVVAAYSHEGVREERKQGVALAS